MTRIAISSILLGLFVSELSADEPKPALRPITDAESVLAVYREDWSLFTGGELARSYLSPGRTVPSSGRVIA